MGTPADVNDFCGDRAPSVLCLADPAQKAFQAFGIGRAGAAELLAPSVFASATLATLEGHLPGPPVGDPLQMPATFVVGKGGRIRLAYYSRTVADHPPSATILAALP